MNYDNIFKRFLFEAPEDSPPDIAPDDTAPDIPADDSPPDMPSDDGPPDMPSSDDPPDMPEDDFGADDFTDDTTDNPEANLQDLGLDDKVSAIMNMNLYQRYLTLLNTINTELTNIRNNNDTLRMLSSDSLKIIDSLEKLDENIRLYLKNSFLNENYSKNLLFFNKCLNLLKLLNDVFDKDIKKGSKDIK